MTREEAEATLAETLNALDDALMKTAELAMNLGDSKRFIRIACAASMLKGGFDEQIDHFMKNGDPNGS